MLPGLSFKQRINAPPTIEPHWHSTFFEKAKDLYDSYSGESHFERYLANPDSRTNGHAPVASTSIESAPGNYSARKNRSGSIPEDANGPVERSIKPWCEGANWSAAISCAYSSGFAMRRIHTTKLRASYRQKRFQTLFQLPSSSENARQVTL